MTLPSGSSVYFGSPACGAIAFWQIRLQWFTAGQYSFYLHRTDANNYLQCFVSGTSLTLNQVVAGVTHQLATATIALTNSTWYWLQLTQFPSVLGDVAYVQAVLFNDTGPGAIGSQVASIAGPTFDAMTALVGRPALFATGAEVNLGGAFTNVFAVNLFGPGAVATLTNFGTGFASLAWDGSRSELGMSGTGVAGTQTYPNGPVTSFGAARIDAAPAGTFSSTIYQYIGGAPTGTQAIPVKAAGNVLGVSVACKGSGLASTATVSVGVDEYDSGGTFLRGAAVASISGTSANAGWGVLSGTYTTGTGCAYVRLSLNAFDTATPGTSANASVWFDNVQCWNVTATGQGLGSMPYCELRMPNSGAQLMVSGLLGDLPAPAFLAFGTYLANWPTGGSLSFAIGRRGSVTPGARLGGSPVGWYGTVLAPQSICVLDASSYGGYYIQVTVTGSGWNPRFVSESAADLAGVYHLFTRFLTQQAGGNLPNVQVRPTVSERGQAWYGLTNLGDLVGSYFGPFVAPMTASNQWQVVDTGQVPVPISPRGALTDETVFSVTPRTTWEDITGGGSVCQAGWQLLVPIDGSLLVPIDGSLLMGIINNPSNAPFALLTSWLWCYADGLLVNRAGAADGSSWLYSSEVGPLPSPARGGGGPGTQNTGVINVNSGADPYLMLDPTLMPQGASAGVNQFGVYIADQSGAVLPFFAELAYSPLYLYPR